MGFTHLRFSALRDSFRFDGNHHHDWRHGIFGEGEIYHSRDPKPGDIVTFQDPEIPGRVLIKRCIAVEGQTVDLVDGNVVIDGVILSEPYTHGLPSEPLKTALGTKFLLPLHHSRRPLVGHGR